MLSVCLDIDGVVLDFNKGLQDYLKQKGYDFKPEECTDYNYRNVKLDFDASIIYDAMKDINLYNCMTIKPRALEAIDLLKRHCKVYGYTASVDVPEIIDKRSRLLSDLGIDGRVIVGDKPVIPNVDALFDDCLDVHRVWFKAKTKTKQYLINAPYNQLDESKDFDLATVIMRSTDLYSAVNDFLQGVI